MRPLASVAEDPHNTPMPIPLTLGQARELCASLEKLLGAAGAWS
jgi:hypothetical protein